MINDEMLKLTSDIFNLLVISGNYCKQNLQNEEINHISTQVEILTNKADVLNSLIINSTKYIKQK